jgi:DNA-binding NtrC family response regulator
MDKTPRQEFVSIEEFVKRSIMALQGEYKEEEIAETLGISRKNLWEKRKKWNLIRPIQNEKTSPDTG